MVSIIPRPVYPLREELPVAIEVGLDAEVKRRTSAFAENRNMILQSAN
jgi:hypothetical protein